MKKIALVYSVPMGEVYEQMGIAYIASFMRKNGWEVKIICLEAEQNALQSIIDYHPAIIGFNVVSSNILKMIEIIQIVKKHISVHCVFGGVGASAEGLEIIDDYDIVDVIVYGEGELTFLELSNRLVNGSDIKGCKGIVYKKNGKIVKEPPRELIEDMDSLPFPARDILFQHSGKMTKQWSAVFLSTSRGCIANCSFCDTFMIRDQPGKIWRGRSAQKVVEEIELIYHKGKYNIFHFQDRSFEDPGMIGYRRMRDIAQGIIDRNLHIAFSIYIRAETWKQEHLPLIELLKKAGLLTVYIGLESGSEYGLEVFNKRASLSDNYETVRLFKQQHVSVIPGFIMFHPYNTFQELRKNIDFLEETKFASINRLLYSKLLPTPKTELYNRINTDNLFKTYNRRTGENIPYNFIDTRIQNLSESVEDEFFDYSDGIYSELIYTELSNLCAWNHKFLAGYMDLYDKVQQMQKYCDEVLLEMNENNARVFRGLIQLAENNADIDALRNYRRQYSFNYESKYKEVQNYKLKFFMHAKRLGYSNDVLGLDILFGNSSSDN